MGFRKNTWNRTVNTVGVVPRTVGTGVRGVIDTGKSALNAVLDFGIGMGKTFGSIKQAINDSFNKDKRYKRLRKIPVSLVCLLPMLGEGTIETLRGTSANVVANTVDTAGNLFINEGNAIKLIGKADDPKTYQLLKTELRDINPRNVIANALMDK